MANIADTPNHPHSDIEAEQCVLGALLVSDAARDNALTVLSADDFYSDTHRGIFEAISQAHQSNEPVSAQIMARKTGISREELLALVNSEYSAYSLPHYVVSLKDKSHRRQLYRMSKIIAGAIDRDISVDDIVKDVEGTLMAISGVKIDHGPTHIKDLIGPCLETFERRHKQQGPQGITSGFPVLDEFTGGFLPGNLVIVAGRASMGKTSFALSLALYAALTGNPILIFSLEMTKQELMDRLFSALSEIALYQIRSGFVAKRDYPKLSMAASKMFSLNIYIDDRGLNSYQIINETRKMVRSKGIKMAMVDYLQIVPDKKERGETKTEMVGRISMGFKTCAKSLGIPFIALSQLSRDVDKRNDHRPIMADIRDSGNVEQDADIILFVYRDSVYNRETPENIAEIIIGKNRNGPVGIVNANFKKELSIFEKCAEQSGF